MVRTETHRRVQGESHSKGERERERRKKNFSREAVERFADEAFLLECHPFSPEMPELLRGDFGNLVVRRALESKWKNRVYVCSASSDDHRPKVASRVFFA